MSIQPGPEPVITTRRVVLRPWREGDAPALTAIYGDPLSSAYIDVPQPYDVTAAVEFVRRAAGSRSAGTAFHYAVTLSSLGSVVGSAYLHDCDIAAATTEISYLIHPGHRGRGLATAALAALSDAALSAGFEQVLLRIAPTNPASETVAIRAGFGLLRLDTNTNCWHKKSGTGTA